MVGLLRLLFLMLGFVILRRVWRSFATRPKDQAKAPRPEPEDPSVSQARERELGTGQKIEDAEYEELD